MEKEKLREKLANNAKEKGFQLNPNEAIVDSIVDQLIEREKKMGAQYCPCRRPTGNKKDDEKIVCPCVFHEEEIKRDGHCLCMLYVK